VKLSRYTLLPLLALTLGAERGAYEYSPVDAHTLHYRVEWRLIHAGDIRFTWSPQLTFYSAALQAESAGLVSKLYRVKDDYHVQMNNALCAQTVSIHAEEGKRRKQTNITFDRAAGKVFFFEKDLIKNTENTKEVEAAGCVHDYFGGLAKLRASDLAVGKSMEVPISDGKKFARVKIEAEERERIKTSLGTFNTIRYQVHMFNGALINKKARMYVWLTDDPRRLPVQLRVKMSLLIGTITMQLEKEERG
jgi:hypothetical protein